jgi:hypothetical protein
MHAEDFNILPVRPGKSVVQPADSTRRGRDERRRENPEREPGADDESESRPRPPATPEPSGGDGGLDILARSARQGRNLAAFTTGFPPQVQP